MFANEQVISPRSGTNVAINSTISFVVQTQVDIILSCGKHHDAFILHAESFSLRLQSCCGKKTLQQNKQTIHIHIIFASSSTPC
jgi:hypothetical protein